jgi:hypothetical protein
MTLLTIKNYVHMQKFLWFSDRHHYVHEGQLVDNANLLNTYCFISARLQEVCQAVLRSFHYPILSQWRDRYQ